MVRGNAIAHALNAGRVQTRQRNGEAVPELLLELRQHRLRCQHEDAFASASRHEFAHQNAGFQRLADAHRIRNENARPRLRKRLKRRVELVGHRIHRRVMRDADLPIVCQRRRADERLQIKLRLFKAS